MAYKPFDLNDPFNVDVKLYHRKGFPDNLGMSIMKVSRLHDKLMKQQY